FGDAVDEPCRRIDQLAGVDLRYNSLWADAVVDDLLASVRSAKKLGKASVEANVVFAQSGERATYAAMSLDDPAGAFGNQRLRRVKTREIGGACRFIAEMRNVKLRARFAEVFSPFAQVPLAFGCHKSTPSKRI